LLSGLGIPAQDNYNPENPPVILVASSINEVGELSLVSYQTIYIGMQGDSYNHRSLQKVSLKGVKIFNASGTELKIDSVRKLLADKETPILATSYGSPLPVFYKNLFAGESLVFIFPKAAPNWKKIQDPGRPVN
jgi:hypothetical protein